MRHRTAVAVAALIVAFAGCVGVLPGTQTTPPESSGPPTASPAHKSTASPSSATPTAPPAPSGSVDLPEGPKEPPERPPTLNASSVHEYVERYEYRYAYNSLWVDENSTVTLACRVDDVTERPWGYEAIVTCTGSSETDGLNGDWFTQTYRYRLSETATNRTQIEPREPVPTPTAQPTS